MENLIMLPAYRRLTACPGKISGSVSFGADYLHAVAFFYPFIGISLVLRGIIRSSGGRWKKAKALGG